MSGRFYRTWHSDRYFKPFVDHHIARSEGRHSPEFIEEMREEAFFDIFYECRFPDEDEIDERGYRVLITNDQLDRAFIADIPETTEGLVLGADLGVGGDENVYVLRSPEAAWVESHNRSNDTMTNVTEIVSIMEEYGVKPAEVLIDDIGAGRGVSDRLQEMGYAVNGVSVGEKPQDETKYKNIKAEAFWHARMWVAGGGKIARNDKFRQLATIKYKTSTDKVLQIEPKEELKKRTGKSPDYAEAFMLTFVQGPPEPGVRLL